MIVARNRDCQTHRRCGRGIAALIVLLAISVLFARAIKGSNDTQRQTNQLLSQSMALYGSISSHLSVLGAAVDRLADHETERLAAIRENTTEFGAMSKSFAENAAAYRALSGDVTQALSAIPPLVSQATQASLASKLAADAAKASVDELVLKAASSEKRLDEIMEVIRGGVVNWPRIEVLLSEIKIVLGTITSTPPAMPAVTTSKERGENHS
jgi:hypothetical protein